MKYFFKETKFFGFIMVVIVSISIGLTFYYFLYSEETFAFVDENGTGLISYTNQGEVIDIAIERNHPTAEAYSLVSSDESVLKFKEEAQTENCFMLLELLFEDKNFKAIPEIDKERLKIIFDIAKELEPRSLFTMSLTYLSMFVEGMIGEECAIDFCDKLMAFTDKYVEEHYEKEARHGTDR